MIKKRASLSLQKVVLFIASALICILLSEVILGLLCIPRFYKAHSAADQFSLYLTDKGIAYYVNIPSSNIQFIYDGNPRGYFGNKNEINHITNSWGFRGREFSYTKPPHTFRIAFLGDSLTFGEGVRFEDTYPEKFAQLMKQKYKTKGINFESYNFGVGGYNISQSLFLLEKLVLSTHPDIIILAYNLNDAEPALFYEDSLTHTVFRRPREISISEGLPEAQPPKTLLFKLHFTRFLWQLFSKMRLSRQTEDYYNSLYKPNRPAWQITKKGIARFISICEENHLSCYILCFPILYKLNEKYPFKPIHTLIKNEIQSAASSSTHFIDLFSYLKGKKDTEFWVHPTDQHPNEIVHRIAAEVLFKAVSEDRNTLQRLIKDNNLDPN